MRRQRVEGDLRDAWEQRGAGPTLEEYEAALLRGDDVELAAYEKFGTRRIRDATARQAFAERAEAAGRERMPAGRRQALEEYERFEGEREKLGHALGVRDHTARTMAGNNLQGTRDTADGTGVRIRG